MNHQKALQDLIAPEGICYGCGAQNPQGLRIKSYWDSDNIHVVMTHRPQACFSGWPNLVYGGLIACLVDCHSNWTAMASHYRAERREPSALPRLDCVTGSLGIKYIKPTPMGEMLRLRARVDGEIGRKTRVLCEVYAGDTLTALGDSIFVRVDVGHLAQKSQASSMLDTDMA